MVRYYTLAFCLIAASIFARPILSADTTYDEGWKIVEKHLDKQLPKSALEVVNGIYAKAKREGSTVNFIKAVAYKLRLEQDTREDNVVSLIADLRKEANAASLPERNILHAYLARVYMGYYNANAYLIDQRTTLATDSLPPDITTWDAASFKKSIFKEVDLALSEGDKLQGLSIKKYAALFTSNQADPELVTPTLYDGLAHLAQEMYNQLGHSRMYRFGNSTSVEVADDFPLEAAFAPVRTFVKASFDSTGTASDRALRLYQEVLQFHLRNGNTVALIDNDLSRLGYINTRVRTEESDSLYVRSLTGLYEELRTRNEVVQVAARLIEIFRGSNPKKAHALATEAIRLHPNALFAPNVRNMKMMIEQPVIGMTIENSVQPGKPSLAEVQYKNVKTIYLRLLVYDDELPPTDTRNQLSQLKRIRPLIEWSENLPDFGDFTSHTAEIKIKALDKNGRYVLLISTDPEFSENEQSFGIQQFWVTKLSLVKYETNDATGTIKYFVHDAVSGAPVTNAAVKIYTTRYNYNSSKYEKQLFKTTQTDAQGKFVLENQASNKRPNQDYYERTFVFDISKDDDRYISDGSYQYPRSEPEESGIRTYFFTDRSIYRPGQTIYFKGIMVESNVSKFENRTVAGKKTTVEFYDVNHQLISKQEFTTNEFGSFNGTFTAPVGKLNGSMIIQDLNGSVSVRVEEYKRPTFNVKFDEIRKGYKVGDSIIVTGKAMSFAGAALDGAAITYKVTRVMYFPYWFDWWRPIPYGNEVVIATGSGKTQPDGTFRIAFVAKPDKSQSRANDPVFNYKLAVDVTDISGETQSGESSASAAYYSLIGTASVPEIIEQTSGAPLIIRTTNINGAPAPSRNDIRIEKLAELTQPIRKRLWQTTDTTTISRAQFQREFPIDEYRNESDMNTWSIAEQILARTISLDSSGVDSIKLSGYKPGVYKVTLTTHDPAGKDLKKVIFFKVYSKRSTSPSFVTPLMLTTDKLQYEPGNVASFVLSSSYEDALVYYEVISHRGLIKSEQILIGKSQRTIEIPITEQDRGGMSIAAYLVHDYRMYPAEIHLDIPWANKDLAIKIETFRSKLKPGDKDEWRITLKGPKADPVAAEFLAAMYDASLDEIEPHHWDKFAWNSFSPDIALDGISLTTRGIFFTNTITEKYAANFDYGRYVLQSFGLEYLYGRFYFKNRSSMRLSVGALDESAGYGDVMADKLEAAPQAGRKDGATPTEFKNITGGDLQVSWFTQKDESKSNLDQIPTRKNFNETAFFYPALRTNGKGEITFSFTAPEALTTWRMMGYAHTPDLKTGYIEQNIVTQKELMVQPNVPRFLREGDSVVFKSKVVNLSSGDLAGTVRLSILDATTMQPYDNQVALQKQEQPFATGKGRSTVVSWRLVVPEGAPTLLYRVVAASSTFSDGEEAPIPVLSNKILVTETLPLNVRGKSLETYRFEKLAAPTSPTLRNYKLTFEMSSNPAWYAVQALPMLMEFPYECSEQIFNRFYANSIAFSLANSNPRIKRFFDSWKGSKETLLSNLEKNQDLKQVLIEETPWVLQGKDETERKHRVGLLFAINTMSNGLQAALSKLKEQQTSNGGWPWFTGMPESDHITQVIVTGFGRLRAMGIKPYGSEQMIHEAVRYMDGAMDRWYRELKRYTKNSNMENDHLSYSAIQYLYARSYFKEIDIESQYETAFNYWRTQAVKYWTGNTIMAQSMIGIALFRFDRLKIANAIVASLKERALSSKELGMYWKQNAGWFWYELPIETQAVAIELFDEVAKDENAVEEMKIWLLKQKQVTDWKTTTATADACYALLGRGTNLLASDKLVSVTIGGKELSPRTVPNLTVEEGTGYIRTTWNGSEIKPEMGNVTLTKVDDGIAWGAMYWQYFERLDKITSAASPLTVTKKLYVKASGAKGAQLQEITEKSPIHVGDKVTSRIMIRVDRDMEYIHLKDMRSASFEPISQLSGFMYSGGLGYYESIKDASTNFFIHYLPKGTYILEYDLRASHTGSYLGGITTIQSMYAPEFAGHSEGITVTVAE